MDTTRRRARTQKRRNRSVMRSVVWGAPVWQLIILGFSTTATVVMVVLAFYLN